MSNTNVPYCSVSPTEWRGPSLLCPSFTSLSQREAATLLLSPFKELTNYIYKIKHKYVVSFCFYLNIHFSLSRREAATLLLSPFKGLTNWIYKKYTNTYSNLFVGCHSPALPFLKVTTNYIYNDIKDKSTNTKKGWESTSSLAYLVTTQNSKVRNPPASKCSKSTCIKA